jgi:REST corepressor 1
VGKNYQVVVPETVPMPENYPDKALLVWSPAKWIQESKLDEYITLAKETYSYNAEQALGMLFWHKHDLEKAVIDLANFTPYPDEWTKEEKALFAQAFQFHGKCFYR